MLVNSLHILVYLILLISLNINKAYSNERCKNLIKDIREAHYYYFGVDFPYWFSVAQAEKESNCRHNILSSDGIGSEGFAQITFKWWQDKLKKENIFEIKSIKNHALAQAYINKTEYNKTYCKKLFEMYQRYNGGGLVSKELRIAKSCNWLDGYRNCKRKDICVLYDSNKNCKQYKNACDINYQYSVKIYEYANKYKISEKDNLKYVYW